MNAMFLLFLAAVLILLTALMIKTLCDKSGDLDGRLLVAFYIMIFAITVAAAAGDMLAWYFYGI